MSSKYDDRESRNGGGSGGYQQRNESSRYEGSGGGGGGGGQRGQYDSQGRRDDHSRNGDSGHHRNNDYGGSRHGNSDRPQDSHRGGSQSYGGNERNDRGGSSNDAREHRSDQRESNPYSSNNYSRSDDRNNYSRSDNRNNQHDDRRRDDKGSGGGYKSNDGGSGGYKQSDGGSGGHRPSDGGSGRYNDQHRDDRRPHDNQYSSSGSRDQHRDSHRDNRDYHGSRDHRDDQGRTQYNDRNSDKSYRQHDDRGYQSSRNNQSSNDRYSSQPPQHNSSDSRYQNDSRSGGNDRYYNDGGNNRYNRSNDSRNGGGFTNDNGFGQGNRGRNDYGGGGYNNDNQNRGSNYQNDNKDRYNNDGGYPVADGNSGAPAEPVIERAPRDWVPERRDIDELINDTADKVQECEIAGDQEVEIRNSDIQARLTSWENSGLDSRILDNLKRLKYTNVRAIQAAMIPQVLAGYDVIGQAETSAGKTAAFGLPIVDYVLKRSDSDRSEAHQDNGPFALIIAPTRELAGQIVDSLRTFAARTDVKVCLAIGQQNRRMCVADIGKGCDILVGTCGRLMDLIEKTDVVLDHLKFFVLDEADRLLQDKVNDPDTGHLATILNDQTFNKNADSRQTILTSATFDNSVESIAREIMKPIAGEKELLRIVLAKGRLSNRVKLEFHRTTGPHDKNRILRDLLRETNEDGKMPKTLIFVQQKKNCDYLAAKIGQFGVTAQTLHGDRTQDKRDELINQFKRSKVDLLVTTDVLSRGIDVVDLERVINFDLPDGSADQALDTFIHRSGRTGRMHMGTCISFVDVSSENDQKLSVKLAELLKTQGLTESLPQFLDELAKENAGRVFTSTYGRGRAGGVGGRGDGNFGGGATGSFNRPKPGGFGGGGGFPSSGGGFPASGGGFPASGGGFPASGGGFPSSGETSTTGGGGGFPSSGGSSSFGSAFTKSNDETPTVGGGFGAARAAEKKQEEEVEVRGFGAAGLGSSSFGGEKKEDAGAAEEEDDDW